jgi:hypothetical protein
MVTTDGPEFTPFERPDGTVYGVGAAVLAYVLKYGHTISVDVDGLWFARKVAIDAMHGRKADDPVVTAVRDALARIDYTIAYVDAEERREAEVRQAGVQPKPKAPIGPMPSSALKF